MYRLFEEMPLKLLLAKLVRRRDFAVSNNPWQAGKMCRLFTGYLLHIQQFIWTQENMGTFPEGHELVNGNLLVVPSGMSAGSF